MSELPDVETPPEEHSDDARTVDEILAGPGAALLNLANVATVLGVSTRQAQRIITGVVGGRPIPTLRVGASTRVARQVLIDWIFDGHQVQRSTESSSPPDGVQIVTLPAPRRGRRAG